MLEDGRVGASNEATPLNFGQQNNGRHEFVRRAWAIVLILAAVAGAVAALWFASQVFFLLFTGALLAIFLRTLSDWVAKVLRVKSWLALTIVIVGLLALFAGAGWLLAAPATEQIQALTEELPKALAQAQQEVQRYSWGRNFLEQLQSISHEMGPILGRITNFFSITVEGVAGFLIICFFGIYFAVDPDRYILGFLSLIPRHRRARAETVIHEVGVQLRHWLVGQLVTMTIIGVATWLGLLALGVPLPGVLGFITGLLDFVPVVGPWVAGILSALLGTLKNPMLPVYVAALFAGLHLLESHLLIPQVQKYSTRLPPVLTILALALFTKWFGFFGLFLATPLLVVVIVLVRTLYQEDVLHERKS